MLSKRKKIRIAIASVAIAILLGVSGTGFAVAANANEISWGEVTIAQVYQFGDVVEIPDCRMNYGGKEYTAMKMVVYPSGAVKNENSFVVAESGKYIVRYQVNVDGKILTKEHSFVVKNQMYGLTNKNSTIVYGTSEYLPSNVQGLRLSLAKDDVFTFNQVIDVSEMTKEDILCKFYLTPTEQGEGKTEASSLKIMLTDIYNPDNTVTIHYKNTLPNYLHGKTTYTKAAANGQKESGLEWRSSYKGPEKEDYIVINNRWFDMHTDDAYGFYSEVRSNGTAVGNFVDNYNFFALDYTSKKVYQQYSWFKSWDDANLVTDLDDTRIYPDNPWGGFTTGEVFLSIWGEGYNTATMNMFITDIASLDLTTFNFIDNDAPDVTVDLGDYTENSIPNAIVDKPYTVFEATAYDIVDGDIDVRTLVYYNYYSSLRALSEITDGKFIPKREGDYTIVYIATDKMGNVTTKCIDVTAKKQTVGLSLALGEQTTTATVGEIISVAGYQAFNSTGNIKGSVTAILKSNPDIYYEIGKDWKFCPVEAGVFEIKYTVSDYIETVTESYEVTVKKTEVPLIFSEATLPRALIKNATYEFPVLKAYDYSGDIRQEAECELYILADDENEAVKAENCVWQVAADTKVKLIYKITRAGKTATKEYTLPVVDGGYNDFGALKMNNYFIGNGFTSTMNEEGISYVANATGNARLSFVNKVLLNEFKTSFIFDETNVNYSSLRLSLTDITDEAIKLDITFSYKNELLQVKIGEGEAYLLETKEPEVDLYYNTRTAMLLINNVLEIPLANEGFDGFKSAYAYLDFIFEKCDGKVGFTFNRMYTQSFSSSTVDEIAPFIYEAEKISSACTLGEKVTLPALEFYDVLDPNVIATVTVYSPNGSIVQTVDGVSLNGKASAKYVYEFIVEEFGAYSIDYKVVDYTGNIRRYSFVVNSCDEEAPALDFTGKYSTTATVGAEIKVATVNITDNYSTNIDIYVYVYRPDGTVATVKGGKFKADMVGVYTVYYYAFDEAGNADILHYQLTVS